MMAGAADTFSLPKNKTQPIFANCMEIVGKVSRISEECKGSWERQKSFRSTLRMSDNMSEFINSNLREQVRVYIRNIIKQ